MSLNKPMLFKIEQFFHYILCHSIILGARVLGSKSWGRKGFLKKKLRNGILAIKKIVKANILTFKIFFYELTLWHFARTNPFLKKIQGFKSDHFKIQFCIFLVVSQFTKK
jgi:hypothetical protein